MKTHRVRVIVTLKSVVLDPQGQAIHQVIDGLGTAHVQDVRQGKVFDLALDAESPQAALLTAEQLARNVLSNPILETFACSLQ